VRVERIEKAEGKVEVGPVDGGRARAREGSKRSRSVR
jgi:hypothetical protein